MVNCASPGNELGTKRLSVEEPFSDVEPYTHPTSAWKKPNPADVATSFSLR
jgi:hypothetical protein